MNAITRPASLKGMKRPLIIGHRGACGYRPDHTLASYELAVRMGADFIEPDLVATRDGALIARHENEIGSTTDVALRFPRRRTVKIVDGRRLEGFFSEDFTLAEVRTLSSRQPLECRSPAHDGLHGVPTLEDILALARRLSAETGRTIGLYPETKHPSYFRSLGLPLEDPLLAALKAAGLDGEDAPVFIQSFEYANLLALRERTRIPLIFLMGQPHQRPYDFTLSDDRRTYADLTSQEELESLAAFCRGIGPWKRLITPQSRSGHLLPDTDLVARAHDAGLEAHPYTFRNEPRFLAPDYSADPEAEYLHFFRLGVDAVFSDFPDTAVRAREVFLAAAGLSQGEAPKSCGRGQ